MAEWHIPFDHIENNWTDREFAMMVERLVERKNAERKAMRRKPGLVPYLEGA